MQRVREKTQQGDLQGQTTKTTTTTTPRWWWWGEREIEGERANTIKSRGNTMINSCRRKSNII